MNQNGNVIAQAVKPPTITLTLNVTPQGVSVENILPDPPLSSNDMGPWEIVHACLLEAAKGVLKEVKAQALNETPSRVHIATKMPPPGAH